MPDDKKKVEEAINDALITELSKNTNKVPKTVEMTDVQLDNLYSSLNPLVSGVYVDIKPSKGNLESKVGRFFRNSLIDGRYENDPRYGYSGYNSRYSYGSGSGRVVLTFDYYAFERELDILEAAFYDQKQETQKYKDQLTKEGKLVIDNNPKNAKRIKELETEYKRLDACYKNIEIHEKGLLRDIVAKETALKQKENEVLQIKSECEAKIKAVENDFLKYYEICIAMGWIEEDKTKSNLLEVY